MKYEWMGEAACAEVGIDKRIFILEPGQPAEPAKAVCRRCSVARQCLEWALATPSATGILGATTDRERRQMRAYRRARASA